MKIKNSMELNNIIKKPIYLTIVALLLLAAILLASSSNLNHNRIKVACIGDSITYGNLQPNNYHTQLSALLGQGWIVENYGLNDAKESKGSLDNDTLSHHIVSQSNNSQKTRILFHTLNTFDLCLQERLFLPFDQNS